MEGHVLQDWVTIRMTGGNATSGVVQGQPFWFDASEFRDVIAWLDVTEVSVSGLDVNVQLLYQTAPSCDEALFTTLAGPIVLAAGLTVTQMLGSVQAPPLAKYLRWMLAPSASTASTWDVNFRILIAVNRPGYRTPIFSTPAKPSYGQAPSTLEEGVAVPQPRDNSVVDLTTKIKLNH